MPADLHRHPRVHVQVGEQAAGRTPGVVDLLVDHHGPGVQVDVIPAEPEQLALASPLTRTRT